MFVGVHALEVLYDETPLPKSPFQVVVNEGCDPTRVVAEGPGLVEALTDKPNKFSIITRCDVLYRCYIILTRSKPAIYSVLKHCWLYIACITYLNEFKQKFEEKIWPCVLTEEPVSVA